MIRCPLSALPQAALVTAALSLLAINGVAQSKATKPKSNPPVNKASKSAAPAANTSDNAVVGVCNGHNVTWGQLVERLKAENPASLNSGVAGVVAQRAADAFFGSNPKDVFSITRAEALSQLRQHPTQQISQQLDLMLTQMAVDQEATKENVQPTQKQVDDKVAGLLKALRDNKTIPKEQSDQQFLALHHVTLDKLKNNYRPQCQVLNLIDRDMTRQLGHPIGPDDMIQASHLLIMVKDVPPTATSDEKKKADEAALARIKGILADIRAGKISFADAAKADSDDPGSKEKGGDLGIFMRGMMLKEFENASFAAKENQVTEPVKSEAGYHIILVTRSGKDIPQAERSSFIEKFEEGKIQTFLQQINEREKVDNRLAKLLPPAPTGFGPGRPMPRGE